MFDFILHFDKHLLEFVRLYGSWVYAILFTIVFAETGFVVTPILPGDSLLFAAGALCATGELSIIAMLALLVFAAFAGNTVNYAVGRFIGPRVFQSSHRLLNAVRLHALAESLGGVETLISHPATMTHASVPADRRAAIGITDGLVRISAGIEDIDDLKEDLTQALDKV